jgi:4-hydroxyphenylpyruvate dioxygenase-like putative hemolysin
MHLLHSLGIPSHGILFEEQRVLPTQQAQHFAALCEQGHVLLAKHLTRDVYLFKTDDRYRLVTLTHQHHTPAALGAVVANTDATLDALRQKNMDIFDGGAVGGMALHLPAFRDTTGRFIYLVEKNRMHDFYANDFATVGA